MADVEAESGTPFTDFDENRPTEQTTPFKPTISFLASFVTWLNKYEKSMLAIHLLQTFVGVTRRAATPAQGLPSAPPSIYWCGWFAVKICPSHHRAIDWTHILQHLMHSALHHQIPVVWTLELATFPNLPQKWRRIWLLLHFDSWYSFQETRFPYAQSFSAHSRRSLWGWIIDLRRCFFPMMRHPLVWIGVRIFQDLNGWD